MDTKDKDSEFGASKVNQDKQYQQEKEEVQKQYHQSEKQQQQRYKKQQQEQEEKEQEENIQHSKDKNIKFKNYSPVNNFNNNTIKEKNSNYFKDDKTEEEEEEENNPLKGIEEQSNEESEILYPHLIKSFRTDKYTSPINNEKENSSSTFKVDTTVTINIRRIIIRGKQTNNKIKQTIQKQIQNNNSKGLALDDYLNKRDSGKI